MPPRNHSIFSEFLTWGAFSLLSVLLAFTIMIRERQTSQLALAAPQSGYHNVSELTALSLPVDYAPFTGASFLAETFDDDLFLAALADLSPAPALLDELNDRDVGSLVVFSLSARSYDELIEKTARQHNVSPLLVKSIIQAESNFNPGALSHKGAVGLMQVMPSTARAMGVYDLRDPQKNILAGVRYLKKLLEQYNDDELLAIAAYNCGPQKVKDHNNQIPPIRETQSYVKRVMKYYQHHLTS